MTMRIENISKLHEKLRALPDAARTAAVAEIDGANGRIADRARQLVPKRTMELHDSIKVQKASPRTLDGRAGTNLWRAHFPEFGTRKMPASPYLHPAAQPERATFPARLAAAIDAANRREAR